MRSPSRFRAQSEQVLCAVRSQNRLKFPFLNDSFLSLINHHDIKNGARVDLVTVSRVAQTVVSATVQDPNAAHVALTVPSATVQDANAAHVALIVP